MKKYDIQEGNEALNRVLLMMNYDNKKTLSENVSVISEQNANITSDAKEMKRHLESTFTDEDAVVEIIKNYNNSSDFVNFIREYNKIGKRKFNIALRSAINSSTDARELQDIQDHLKTININATEATDKNGAAIIKFQFIKKEPPTTPDKSTQTKPDKRTPPPIPKELGNADGVKKFQDWLDINHPGWATGFEGGILSKRGGYGRFGPRTTAAWNRHKSEYLTGTSKPDIENKPSGAEDLTPEVPVASTTPDIENKPSGAEDLTPEVPVASTTQEPQ
jgi:hypothetical protein